MAGRVRLAPSTARRVATLTLGVALLSSGTSLLACGASRGLDGEDAAVDAAPLVDAAVDAMDAAPLPDAATPPDAELLDDAEPPLDAPTDCGACEATSCGDAICVAGACVRTPAPDGRVCADEGAGSTHVCVGGACVGRGCGDGYVEPGPTPEDPDAPPREACDDGNLDDGDACSSTCEPTLVELDAAPGSVTRVDMGRPIRSVGVDATGAVLAAFVIRHGTFGEVYARRFDAAGVPRGDRLVIGTDALLYPAVAGLGEGWVVAYTRQIPGSLDRVAFRLVRPDGTLRAPVDVTPAGNFGEPRVASFGGGFVVVYEDAGTRGDLWARRYRADGSALDAAPVPISTQGASALDRFAMVATEWIATDPPIAATAAASVRWAVVWPRGIDPTTVMLRRFEGATSLDPEPVPLAMASGDVDVTAARHRFDPEAGVEPAYVAVYRDTAVGVVALTVPVAPGRPVASQVLVEASLDNHPTRYPRVTWREGDGPGDIPAVLATWGCCTGPRVSRFTSTVPVPADAAMALMGHLVTGFDGVEVVTHRRGTFFVWGSQGESGAPLRLFLLPAR